MMLRLCLVLVLGVLVSAQGVVNPCATGELPCDPNRPWMRGTIEKYCGHPAELERMRREHPGREVLQCECKHTCDPLGEHAQETANRGWDAMCAARCNPANCECEHPCES